jgi:hypothetical protein
MGSLHLDPKNHPLKGMHWKIAPSVNLIYIPDYPSVPIPANIFLYLHPETNIHLWLL